MRQFAWWIAACIIAVVAPFPIVAQDQQLDDPPLIEIPQAVPVDAAPFVVPVRPVLWSGSVEFGVNGAAGNSDLLNFRIGGDAKRKARRSILTTNWYYRVATSNGVQSENRAQLQGRLEWPIGDSPWSLFHKGTAFYDEFRAFDVRVSVHTGLGYEWINTELTTLKTRLGAGGSWEIGGPNDRFSPEAVFGIDFERQLTNRQKLYASAEYFPEFEDFGDFRIEAKAGYELVICPEWNLTLKLGINNRYDSTPEGKRRNDIEYFGVLLWKF